MNVVAGIVIGLLILGAILGALLKVLEGVAAAIGGTRLAVIRKLGRSDLGAKASIPAELAPNATPLPKSDPDKAALKAADPGRLRVPSLSSVAFKSASASLFSTRDAVSPEITIDRIGELLMMPLFPSYVGALALLSEDHPYPVEAPAPLGAVAAVPFWSPWQPALGEPSFEAPRYQGRWSFLNGYVDEAHAEEKRKVEQALVRKAELLEACDKRNKEVAALADAAQRKHDDAVAEQRKAFDSLREQWERDANLYHQAVRREMDALLSIKQEMSRSGSDGLLSRIDYALRAISLPSFASKEGQSRFDADSGILIHEHRFPDLASVEWVKFVEQKAGLVKKPANQKEKKESAALIYPSLCLRLAAEIARLDEEGIVKAVAINGWADYVEKSTGAVKRAYCASLFATKEQLQGLKLSALDPVAAFSALKGVAARSLELTPVAPILRLDSSDPRFVEPKEVLGKLVEGENLAAMDWEDFEHLCRELFEQAFAGSGAEVKITQASRDQGVDAVVFDPDPLRGGKIVIQAKRYTNTVDVSAVRDLYGALINEGATKGILVTTSHFGPESYSFAKDKPITLLNGNELLGLLQQHGYKFRIDLMEAKARI